MAFDPSAEELATFLAISDVFGWLEMQEGLVEALSKATGAQNMTMRAWARIPAPRWASMITTMQVEGENGENRSLNPVEEGQVGEVSRILAMLAGRGPTPATGEGQGGQGGRDGAGNITEQAAAGAAGAPAAVAPEDAPQGHPGTALP